MLPGLPQIVDLYRLAVAGEAHAGRIKQSVFNRMVSVAHDEEKWVDILLRFGVEREVHYLRGGLKTEFTVVCQRCMNPMSLPVDISFSFGFVRDENEEVRLPGEFEPLWIEHAQMDLLYILEDELLLSLPMAPLHLQVECPAWAASRVINEQTDSGRKNPFSVLAGLNTSKKH